MKLVTMLAVALFSGLIFNMTNAAHASATAARKPMDLKAVLTSAIEKGVSLFNSGDAEGCARAYEAVARRVIQQTGVGQHDLARHRLQTVLSQELADASERAWALRRTFDLLLSDLAFIPKREASLPQGFPAPGPVGHVVTKRYPAYRAAITTNRGMSFWTLFRHIKKNNVAMTAPVEMTLDRKMRNASMAFLYESLQQGETGEQGRVSVRDLKQTRVLSIGMRGRRNAKSIALAKALIDKAMNAHGLTVAGPWRVLAYNSPMVSSSRQFYEVQVPVKRNTSISDGAAR